MDETKKTNISAQAFFYQRGCHNYDEKKYALCGATHTMSAASSVPTGR